MTYIHSISNRNPDNDWIQTRGNPSTHDMELGKQTLDALLHTYNQRNPAFIGNIKVWIV